MRAVGIDAEQRLMVTASPNGPPAADGNPGTVIVIGAGPGGLMAAERLAAAGHRVTVYDRMPSPGRKLLMAGRGGLNLTHSEPLAKFLTRYGEAAPRLEAALEAFPPGELVVWAEGLGQKTFVGTSGRIFPRAMKASPLLRAWLRRLDNLGVQFRFRHRWLGWSSAGALIFSIPAGEPIETSADAVVLALGGASWPRLGSDGAWVDALATAGIAITPLAAANCGVRIGWSDAVRRFEGHPLKRVAVGLPNLPKTRGEAVITSAGLEGGVIYAISGAIRSALATTVPTTISIDLRPDIDTAHLAQRLQIPKGKQSVANFLRKAAGLSPAAIAVLREAASAPLPGDATALASMIKDARLPISGLAGLERAISTAGGVALEAVDTDYMLRARPGVFVAGEMLDWEAPTGGYLLQATFATAVAAAEGAGHWIASHARHEHDAGAGETG